MNKWIFSVALAAALAFPATADAQPIAWPEGGMQTKPGVRWWWMGSAVSDADLEYLMGEYAKAGLGTVEITPIYGVQGNSANNIKYLSNGWMDKLQKVEELGNLHSVQVDMNNGTGWPFGGPTVTTNEAACMLAYRTVDLTANGEIAQDISLENATQMTYSTLSKVMAFPMDKDTRTADTLEVTAYVSGNTLTWTPPVNGKWRLIAVYNSRTRQTVKRAAPGGEGYVLDHFDSVAVKNYLRQFDAAFERTGVPYPATFFNDSYEVYNADWTPTLFEEFEKRRGYKLERHLQELLGLTTDRLTQVRADYRETLSDLLIDNFVKPWTAWAHSHGVKTRNQAHGSPSNLLDAYAEADIPETESFYMTPFTIKGLRTDNGFTMKTTSDFATRKMASSAAHVTGKPLASSETFTWFTEHFRTSLSQMKPEMDLTFLAGVNRMFFHGTTYSPQSAAWPGWKFYAAIDMSPTNAIWRDAPYFLSYIDRCQRFLQWGQPDNDFLVYMPVVYAWHQKGTTLLKRFDIGDMKSNFDIFERVVDSIDVNGFSCDFISDKQLLETTFDGTCLVTSGGARYKALQLPMPYANSYMPQNVQAHLAALEAQGAKILIQKRTRADFEALAEPESMRTQYGLRYIRRSNPTGYHYFITNLTAEDVTGFVTLQKDFASAVLFNPLNGDICKAQTDGINGVYLDLPSGQSVIVQTFGTEVAVDSVCQMKTKDERNGIVLSNPWTLSFVEAEPSNAATYNLDVVRTWESLDENTAKLMGTGVYETTFTLTDGQVNAANGGFLLSLGDVRESARVYVNDTFVGCAWSAPFEVACGNAVKSGENKLRIEVTNLPANRIRQMDLEGTEWRIFEDINMSNISTASYSGWDLVPSGLNAAVTLYPLTVSTPSGIMEIAAGKQQEAPVFTLQGIRVKEAQRPGVYVKGNKKVVVR